MQKVPKQYVRAPPTQQRTKFIYGTKARAQCPSYSIPYSTEYTINEFHEACANGDAESIEKVKQILLNDDYGEIINSTNRVGRTALQTCVISRCILIIEILLANKNCNINKQDRSGWTALHFSISQKETTVLKMLIETKKCDLNMQNSYNSTPLHFATTNNRLDVVSILLETNECKTDIQNEDGFTALMLASKHNYVEIVKTLLSNDPECKNLNIKNRYGSTALHLAIFHNRISIVDILLETNNCDIEMLEAGGLTPLMLACRDKQIEIVRSLLLAGCDVNQLGLNSRSALDCVTWYNSTMVFIDNNNLDRSKREENYELYNNACNEITELLLDYGALISKW
jgi:ankyrin repeat protein